MSSRPIQPADLGDAQNAASEQVFNEVAHPRALLAKQRAANQDYCMTGA